MLASTALWQHRLLLRSIPSNESSLSLLHYYSYIEYKEHILRLVLMVMYACKSQSVMCFTVADLITKPLSFRTVSSFPHLYLKILFQIYII